MKKVIILEGLNEYTSLNVIHCLCDMYAGEKMCKFVNIPYSLGNVMNHIRDYDHSAFMDAQKHLAYANKISAILPDGVLYEEIMNGYSEIILTNNFIHNYLANYCMENKEDLERPFCVFADKIHPLMKPLYEKAEFYYIYLKGEFNEIDDGGLYDREQYYNGLFSYVPLCSNSDYYDNLNRIEVTDGISILTEYPKADNNTNILITYNTIGKSGKRHTDIVIATNLKIFMDRWEEEKCIKEKRK